MTIQDRKRAGLVVGGTRDLRGLVVIAAPKELPEARAFLPREIRERDWEQRNYRKPKGNRRHAR